MRVLVISQYFPPETAAAANRLRSIVRTLNDAGHEVVVVAEKPNYPEGIVQEEYRGGLFEERVVDGVRIIYTWVYAQPDLTFLNRILLYASFMVTAVMGALRTEGSFDVVLASSPPLFVGLAGWATAKLKGAKFVFDVRDIWPDLAIAMGHLENPAAARIGKAIERFIYRGADGITAATAGFCDHVRSVVGIAPPTRRVMNGTEPSVFEKEDRREETRSSLGVAEDSFVVTYAGTMGRLQGLGHIIDAAIDLRDEEEVVIHVRGSGELEESLRAEVERNKLSNVEFFDHCPLEEAAAHMAASDALLVPLADDPIFQKFIPSKLFDSMASGRPVLLSVDGEAREILEEAEAGLFYPPEDGEALAEKIRWLLAHPDERTAMGDRGQRYARAHCTRAVQAEKMMQFLESLV